MLIESALSSYEDVYEFNPQNSVPIHPTFILIGFKGQEGAFEEVQ